MTRRILLSRWTWLAAGILVVSAVHLWFLGRLDLTPTISLVEAEWTLTALVGAIYSADFIRDCILDWRGAEIEDEGTWQAIDVFLLIGVLFLGLHLMLVSFGVLAMLGPTGRATNIVLVKLIGVGFTAIGEQLVLVLVVIRAKRARIRDLASLAAPRSIHG